MKNLLKEISQCTICKAYLPLGPRPVVTANINSKIIIIGQAPGTKVHESGIPWDDQSGKKLRQWLNVTDEQFYNTENFAIIPMGFCYPGKGKTGDLPPRPECAPQWHQLLLDKMPNVELVILVGAYAQKYYLKDKAKRTLTETVGEYKSYLPKYFPIAHPSPTNRFWRAKNPWFEELIVAELQKKVREILN
ncbi:IclR family transcriptional regulator [Winogradskyella sp. PC-19]|uniref:uracil-DNA glycosylase family protein n=1 Tax=unclassified Winogradskyella TaxID=2615021 RepID=UPI000B3D3F71|nr:MULTISPECIES: uracil-DNA glycosylase family protein [unclassified Winogradskyella]ARV09785.1 IclR family transcriptional regulator [Winogradskyella sp. PC-19]RZN82729.1 MAG: uracil-DNA glycosylase family protein [Winogradskyella sp.]